MRRSALSTLPSRRRSRSGLAGMAVGFLLGLMAAFAVLDAASESSDPFQAASPGRVPLTVATGRAHAPSLDDAARTMIVPREPISPPQPLAASYGRAEPAAVP